MHYATSTALHELNAWIKTGTRPPAAPRFQFDPTTGQLAKDQYGNTEGGIRLPPIEVPVATYVSTSCYLGGITVPFTQGAISVLKVVVASTSFDGSTCM